VEGGARGCGRAKGGVPGGVDKGGKGGALGVGGKGGALGVGGKGGALGVCGKMLKPGEPTNVVDLAAMAVDGGNAGGEAGAHVAHAAAVEAAEVDRSTDPKMLRQFKPCGSYYTHLEPLEVWDGIPVITDRSLYDAYVRNRARAHTRRVNARYEALPGFVDVLSEPGSPEHVGDCVAEVHGYPRFGSQGPQRRIYEVMSFSNEIVRNQEPSHPFDRLLYTNALLFPVRGTQTLEAAANSFFCLLRNRAKAIFLKRSLATDLAVPFGHDAGFEDFLNQLALVASDESDAVDFNRSPRMSELPNPLLLPLSSSDHRRAADTRFFHNRELLPTAWAALRAPRTFDLCRWLRRIPEWELVMELWVATPVVVSYLADALLNEYSSVWQLAYSEYYCSLVAVWVHTLQAHKIFGTSGTAPVWEQRSGHRDHVAAHSIPL